MERAVHKDNGVAGSITSIFTGIRDAGKMQDKIHEMRRVELEWERQFRNDLSRIQLTNSIEEIRKACSKLQEGLERQIFEKERSLNQLLEDCKKMVDDKDREIKKAYEEVLKRKEQIMANSRDGRCSPFEEIHRSEIGREAAHMEYNSYPVQSNQQPNVLQRGYNAVREMITFMKSKDDKIARLKEEVETLKALNNYYIQEDIKLRTRCDTYKKSYENSIAVINSLNDEVNRLKKDSEYYKTEWEKASDRCEQVQREAGERLDKYIKENKDKLFESEKKWNMRLKEKDSTARELRDKIIKTDRENGELRSKLLNYETIEEEKKRMNESLKSESRKSEQLQRENSLHQAKIVDLEREIRRLTSEVSRVGAENINNRLEIEQMRAELKSERERVLNAHDTTTKQCDDLMLKRYSEFEEEKEKIKKEYNKRIEELNRTIQKHVDDKFRLREEHSAEIKAICSDNGALITRIRSNHDDALKDKDADMKRIIDDLLRVQKECSREMEKMTAVMENEAKTTKLMYEQALRSSNQEACDFIHRMYDYFKQAADKQSQRFKEARMRERARKQRFVNLVDGVQTKDRGQPDVDEEEESSGVQIEEVLD